MTDDKQAHFLSEREAVELARDFYAKPSADHIRIEERPAVDNTEAGAWVQAWVWVPVSRQRPDILAPGKEGAGGRPEPAKEAGQ